MLLVNPLQLYSQDNSHKSITYYLVLAKKANGITIIKSKQDADFIIHYILNQQCEKKANEPVIFSIYCSLSLYIFLSFFFFSHLLIPLSPNPKHFPFLFCVCMSPLENSDMYLLCKDSSFQICIQTKSSGRIKNLQCSSSNSRYPIKSLKLNAFYTPSLASDNPLVGQVSD